MLYNKGPPGEGGPWPRLGGGNHHYLYTGAYTPVYRQDAERSMADTDASGYDGVPPVKPPEWCIAAFAFAFAFAFPAQQPLAPPPRKFFYYCDASRLRLFLL